MEKVCLRLNTRGDVIQLALRGLGYFQDVSNNENWVRKKPGNYKWIILWALVVPSFTDWKDASSDSRVLFKNLPFFHCYLWEPFWAQIDKKKKKREKNVLNIHGLTLIRGIWVSTSGSSIFGIRALPGVCFTGCLSQPSSTSTGTFPHFWCWGNSHTTFVSLHLGLSDWRVLKSRREVSPRPHIRWRQLPAIRVKDFSAWRKGARKARLGRDGKNATLVGSCIFKQTRVLFTWCFGQCCFGANLQSSNMPHTCHNAASCCLLTTVLTASKPFLKNRSTTVLFSSPDVIGWCFRELIFTLFEESPLLK